MFKKIMAVLGGLVLIAVVYIGYNALRPIESIFPKQSDVFGVKFYATASVPDEKIDHAKAVMAQYLDNDEDGVVDNPKVLEAMLKKKAGMMLTKDSAESEKIFLSGAVALNRGELQDLYASEIHPNGHEQGLFDGTLEEVLHLITHVGYASAYPDVWGEVPGTQIADSMDVARGGQFIKIPKKYPEKAWYHYDDETADYGTMITEYVYWALTSVLGGQDFEGRGEQIANEWELNTRAKVMEKDPLVYNLLTDPQYKMPTVLPDGHYNPPK